MKRLSIIVPIYNVEPYVERCLRSLEDQNIPEDDYEIICINDGSPDRSREVVVRLQGEFKNIVLIDQENHGVSQARNTGIGQARGRFILFTDPDDYVDPNCFDHLLKTAENQQTQVSFLGFTVLNENGSIHKTIFNADCKDKIYTGTEAYYMARGDGKTDPDRMWAVLFESKFLNNNNLRFLPDVPYLEDGEFIARILCLAERCIFDGHSFYQRTSRPGSATNSKLFNSVKATNGFLMAAGNLKRFQKEQDLNENQRKFLNQPIVKFVLLAVSSSVSWNKYKKSQATIKKIKELDIIKVNLLGCNKAYRMCGKAYNISPYFGVLAVSLYSKMDKMHLSNIVKRLF